MTGEVMIWIHKYAVTGEVVNAFLKTFDPEAFDGRGDMTWTERREEAMRFADVTEAHGFYTQQPKSRPLRGDGKPNKPLTAFTVSIVPAEVRNNRR